MKLVGKRAYDEEKKEQSCIKCSILRPRQFPCYMCISREWQIQKILELNIVASTKPNQQRLIWVRKISWYFTRGIGI